MLRLARCTPLVTVLLVPGLPIVLGAQQGSSNHGMSDVPSPRSADIRRTTGPIEIDGRLDDSGWIEATRITDFVERTPREGATPPVETEVLLAYDEANLYVAFIARDPEPEAIRAALQPRDRLWNDDWVGVLLDPYGDASLGYFFLSNPIGVQADLQMTPRNEDSSIDFVFSSAGRVTEDGFVVEMAIPFRSLRIPARDVHEWGIMFVRTWPRSSRHYLTWPAWSRNSPCQLCEVASLEGIRGIQTGGNLELLPSVMISQGGRLADGSDPDSFESGSAQAQPSIGLKYALERGWSGEATLNPDFSQVESDAAEIDVNTTFALFYPERRPFFQEGMDLYRTPMDVFHSRSINAPRAATKLIGRMGGTSLGFIGARDEHTPFVIPFEEGSAVLQAGKSLTNVLRIQHTRGGSYLGALLTDRRLDGGGSGTAGSLDGQYRFGEVYILTGQLVVSHTREPDDPELSQELPEHTFGSAGHTAAFDGEAYSGHAAGLSLAREARTLGWELLYMEVSPTYRADVGFQTQNDFRRATGSVGVTLYPNRPWLERISGFVSGLSYWNFEGVRTRDELAPRFTLAFPRQTSVELRTTLGQEVFRGERLTGIRDHSVSVSSNFSTALRGSVSAATGRRVARTLEVPEVGEGWNASALATIQPWQRLVIQPSISYQELSRLDGGEIFSGYIARSRFSFQYDRRLNLRLVLQYNDFSQRFDVEPLLVYQINPFSLFYLGSTHRSSRFEEEGFVATDRQYFTKLQYLLRR